MAEFCYIKNIPCVGNIIWAVLFYKKTGPLLSLLPSSSSSLSSSIIPLVVEGVLLRIKVTLSRHSSFLQVPLEAVLIHVALQLVQ